MRTITAIGRYSENIRIDRSRQKANAGLGDAVFPVQRSADKEAADNVEVHHAKFVVETKRRGDIYVSAGLCESGQRNAATSRAHREE